jgi:hypothetical protein
VNRKILKSKTIIIPIVIMVSPILFIGAVAQAGIVWIIENK